MAKADGSRLMVVPPSLEISGNSFEAAGEDGGHEQLTANLANSLKLGNGGGGELTPRSLVSWASQVEEEHLATGWSGAAGGSAAVPSPEMHDEGSTRSRSRRKKKKKGKGGPPSTGGEDIPSPQGAGRKSGASRRSQENVPDGSPGRAASHPEINGVSFKSDGNCAAETVDKKSRIAQVLGGPGARTKGSNAVWALKRSEQAEEPKVGGDGQGEGQAVFGRNSGFASPWNEGGDFGWDAAAIKLDAAPPGDCDVSSPIDHGKGPVALGATPPVELGDGSSVVLAGSAVGGSNWESGWEVAGHRRGKASGGGGGRATAGRGQQHIQPGGKRELDRPNRGPRSPGHPAAQDKGRAWQSSKSSPGLSSAGGGFRPSPVTQSCWGKSPSRSLSGNNSSSNWDPQRARSPNNPGRGISASSTILGKLLPQARAAQAWSLTNPPTDASPISGGDAWKGGFPAFSGNGSSVFDDYPTSLYSDSQCSDDDLDSDSMSLASFESEDSVKSHTTQRRNKWFRAFFEDLDELSEQQVHEHDRQWHCPACRNGVGAIDWYKGLQPLLAHAKTVRSKRVKLHKLFAAILEEEIRIRGAVPGTHGSGAYGKWRGLGDENENATVVWPPMVVIRNTQLEKDENEKWIGMGNKELLDLFEKHYPMKARHAYGPHGHRGISVLIFPETPTGYYNAKRLETQFIEARRGKDYWDAPGKLLFQPGGNRILYGYLATPEDISCFNQHSKGKQNLKWESKSFQEMVLSPMRKLDAENKKAIIDQGEIDRAMDAARTLRKTMSVISNKLVLREEELKAVRDRARDQHAQQQQEMEDMESVYKNKIAQLKRDLEEKEKSFERVHVDYETEHMQEFERLEKQASKIPKDKNPSDEQLEQQALVEEEIARHSALLEESIKNQEEWVSEKAELLKQHHQKMMDFKARQWEDLINFEQKLDHEMMEVMEGSFARYKPGLKSGSKRAWT